MWFVDLKPHPHLISSSLLLLGQSFFLGALVDEYEHTDAEDADNEGRDRDGETRGDHEVERMGQAIPGPMQHHDEGKDQDDGNCDAKTVGRALVEEDGAQDGG